MDSRNALQAHIEAYTEGYRTGYRTAIAAVLEILDRNNKATGTMSQESLLGILETICRQAGERSYGQ